MGRIWLAHDEILRRDVALKEMAPAPGMSAEQVREMRAMMIREAQAAARVVHPNVVRVYDVLEVRESPWIVMEYVPSRSLHAIVKVDGPVSPGYAATIGLSLLDALTAAHRTGVLHRDVTPQNVLIGRNGRTVLSDFGAAWLLDSMDMAESHLVGTARYMAPERVASGVSTAEGDLWSLGATLYRAVEGVPPYAQASVMDALAAVLASPPQLPRRAGALTPVLEGLLRREPADRWGHEQTRAGLKRAIEESAREVLHAGTTHVAPAVAGATSVRYGVTC